MLQNKKKQDFIKRSSELMDNEQFGDAELYILSALEASKKDPVDNNFVAKMWRQLAFISHNQGRNQEAENYYQKCLQLLKETKGKSHEEYGVVLGNYAEFLSSLDKSAESIEKSKEAIQILEKVFSSSKSSPNNDVFLAALQSNLSGYLCTIHEYEQAQPYCETALSKFRKALGPDNFYTTTTLDNLKIILKKLQKDDEVATLEKSWAIRDEHLGKIEEVGKKIGTKYIEKLNVNGWETDIKGDGEKITEGSPSGSSNVIKWTPTSLKKFDPEGFWVQSDVLEKVKEHWKKDYIQQHQNQSASQS